LILVAGFVNGIGRLPERSVELHDAPNRMQDTPAKINNKLFIGGSLPEWVCMSTSIPLTTGNKTSNVSQ
jgi:hypothetical protein